MAKPLRIEAELKSSPGARLQAFAHEQLRLAELHLSRQGAELHDGVHQARKCLRRTRAALALAAAALDSSVERIDDELGRLCRGLSSLRDTQALVDAIDRFGIGAAGPIRTTVRGARVAALVHRDLAMARALARDPGFAARRHRLFTIIKRVALLDWKAVRRRDLAKTMQRGERRLEKARRRARQHPDRDASWHIYRRRLRRLKEQNAILAELQPGLHHLALDLGRQAHILGESQDDVLVLKYCHRSSPFNAPQRRVLRQLARARLKSVRDA
jgi:hypothetical protein